MNNLEKEALKRTLIELLSYITIAIVAIGLAGFIYHFSNYLIYVAYAFIGIFLINSIVMGIKNIYKNNIKIIANEEGEQQEKLNTLNEKLIKESYLINEATQKNKEEKLNSQDYTDDNLPKSFF